MTDASPLGFEFSRINSPELPSFARKRHVKNKPMRVNEGLLQAALVLLFCGLANAQDVSATLQGTVLDTTGRSVPGAKVSLTLKARNQVVRTITTDVSGSYAAPLIPIGTYTLRVEADGFKSFEQSEIILNVADNKKVNVTLELGDVAQTVEVQAAATGVELASPANATTIEGTQVRELALGTRNYQQLVGLMPGVSPAPTDELYIGVSSPSGTAATLPFSINGQRNSANNWTLDGADNVDRGSNLTLLNYPSIEAIDQFKVERSAYTADSGRAGGGQINVVTKSGTSQFHGSAYEFVRNDAFAANNFINNANRVNVIDGKAQVPPLRWNDFGFTIGGPVAFGGYNKERNKTFFFFSQEFRRIITYTTFQPTVPTTGMLQGSFPTPVCISYSGGACKQTSTQIPSSLINPISQQYITDIFSKLPLNATSTTSGFFPQRNVYNTRQELVRIDHSFSDRFSIWGRFMDDDIPTTEPGGLFTGSTIPNGATTSTNAPGRSYVVHVLNTIRPTLLNEFGFNFSRGAIQSTPIGLTNKSANPNINVPEPYANTQGVVPTLSFTGGSSLIGYGPYTEFNRNYNFFDQATWVRGRHSFRLGVTVNRYQKTENAASGQGVFAFTSTGAPSGTSSFNQSFANFLLGNVGTFTQPSTDITPNLWAWQTEAFAQDDWKVTPHLNVYLGVRWSYFGQPTDSNGILTNFYGPAYSAANAPQINPTNGNVIVGTGNNPFTNGIINGGKGSPFGDTVGKSSWTNFAPRVGVTWDPIGDGKTAIRTGYGMFYDSSLFGTYEQSIFQNPPYVQNVTINNGPFNNITAGTPPGTVSTAYVRGTPAESTVPYVQQWSFSAQRQFPWQVAVDTSYVGTKGTHLLGIVDINQAYPGVALAAGLHAPNGNTVFTSADDPRINAVRPYLGFNAINMILPAFDSNYHSLQVGVNKQFSQGNFIRLAYTWSKNMTDNGSDRSNAPQNSYNWHSGEYGPATLDRTQVLTVNYVYTIPIFAGSRGLTAAALKGWQLSGIFAAYTGAPFTVTTSNVDPAGLGLLGNSAASSRPDMVCDPNANAPHTIGQWWNTACFAPVPQGQVRPGNAGRGVIRGPGFWNFDTSLMKNFSFKERVNLQFRGETFNTLNHANPAGFGSTNITSTLFGQITSYRAPRRIQLALKLTF